MKTLKPTLPNLVSPVAPKTAPDPAAKASTDVEASSPAAVKEAGAPVGVRAPSTFEAGSSPRAQGTPMSAHQDLQVAANHHVTDLGHDDADPTLAKATATLNATAAAVEDPEDQKLVHAALDATGRAAKQISTKAPLQVTLFQNKDGVSATNLLGTVKKQGDVATFVPHNPTLSPFVLPKALSDGAEHGRVVRLVRQGRLQLQSPTADPAAQVEVSLESAAGGNNRSRFIGPVVIEDGKAFVQDPYHAGETNKVPLQTQGGALEAGTIVDVTVDQKGVATLIGDPLAKAGSARAQMYGIFARHQIDPTFPPDVMEEVAALQKNDGIQSGLDSGELKDFRDLAFVTIDNADSRDLDQAMYIEKHPDGSFDVFYALADASHYIKPETALFRESMKRAASYYLPGLAVPMLPAALSEDLVSLNAGQDRRAMVMKLSVGADGTSAGTTIERGVINSRAKLAYDRVDAFHTAVKGGKGASDTEHHGHDFTDTLMLLKEVGELRMQDAASRDVVSFRRTPVKVVTNDPAHAGGAKPDADAPIFSVIADERNDVERWNEQISLLANIEGAKFFLKHLDKEGANPDLQAIFRVHDAPPKSRIDNLHTFINKLVDTKGLDQATWKWNRGKESLAKYLARLPATGDHHRVSRAIHQQAIVTNVRSQFSAEAGGHHGVGTEEGYARFSSPMRELVGIFVHKEAFEALLGTGSDPAKDNALRERIIDISNAAKQIQGRVTKEANKLAIDELFAPDLDLTFADRRTFKGTIMGLSSGKIYVQLDDPPIDVKVYISGAEKYLGGDIDRAADGVSLEGIFDAKVSDAIDIRVESYDEKSGRYHLVPVVDAKLSSEEG